MSDHFGRLENFLLDKIFLLVQSHVRIFDEDENNPLIRDSKCKSGHEIVNIFYTV